MHDMVEDWRATRIIPANPAAIAEAARVLAVGGLVAFPTETVYGLGADATNDRAIARLYAAKDRPSFNPLIVHVKDFEAARQIADFDETTLRLASVFWPGPLTLVLPKPRACPVGALATAGLDSVAVRVPDHAVAHDILAAFGGPVVAPSANSSGRLSATRAEHVRADLDGRVDLIIDGGATSIGLESTIIGCVGAVMLLRPGAIPRQEVEEVLGRPISSVRTQASRPMTCGPGEADEPIPARVAVDRAARTKDGRVAPHEAPPAPGMLASHYAPRALVRMNAASVAPGEALLAFGPDLPASAPAAVRILNLSAVGDVIEAAANLFAYLHALDECCAATIAVMPVPEDGLGAAINDRLRRAAAPRPTRRRTTP
jgi:L-threonylcarbamoyladenylate synthase